MRRFFCLAMLISLCGGASAQTPAINSLATIPQGFAPNRGQADPAVDFTSHGPGYTLFLSADSAYLQLVPLSAPRQTASLRLRLVGASQQARAEAVNAQEGKSNYFLGNDPKRWLTDIPQFGRVEFHSVYPGIDVAYYGNNQHLEFDFILAPHADPSNIRLVVDGADRVRIDPAGDLVLKVGSAEIRQRKPLIYQDTPSGRKTVSGRYVALAGKQVGFELERYDREIPLVIDPVLVFSTFWGGAGTDQGLGLTVDANGNVYMCGPAGVGDYQGSYIGAQSIVGANLAAYVLKISPSHTLISSTFIAGTNDQAAATAIALDLNGNIYLTGNTISSSFPTLNPVQKTYGGAGDVFVLELNSSANALIYSTYLGGSELEAADGIGVDSNGNTLVDGWTGSKNFPVLKAAQSTLAGNSNAFAAKIAPGGSSLVYSTYYGGSGNDYSNGMTVDSSGDLIAYGDTTSPNFPTLNAFQPSFCGWKPGQTVTAPHGWVAEFGPTGVPVSATYICGSAAADSVRGAAFDAQGNLTLTGSTASLTFPTLNPIQASFAGGESDIFLTKLSPASKLLFSTYLGGSGTDVGRGVVFDSVGNVYLTGNTASANFPTVNPTQAALGGGDDAFLVKINAAESAIVFSTYLGGSGEDFGSAIAVDSLANAYVAGFTASTNFPTASPLQAKYGGGSSDAFLSEFSTCSFTFSTAPSFGPSGGAGTITVTTTPECSWTAESNAPWIAIKSGPAEGVGSGSVSFTVPANSGAGRTGTLTIAGQTVTITQNAVTMLTVVETNAAAFTQGQKGAVYTATVSNAADSAPTAGTVTLTQSLPQGLTLVSMAGSGWTCAGAVCQRSDALAGGSSYPPVTVTVNVATNSATQLTAQVSASGGGSAKANGSDVTQILYRILLQLTNQGPDSLISTGLQLSGFAGTETNNCPPTLGVTASCAFTLIYSPVSQAKSVDPELVPYAAADRQLLAGAPDPARLVFFGDSITLDWDRPAPFGAGSLSNIHPFVNRGIAGQTTEQMLLRFRQNVLGLKPAVVQIFGGTNNLAMGTGSAANAAILDQIESMTEIAQANGIKVMIASITPVIDTPTDAWTVRRPNAAIRDLNQSIQAYCRQSGAVYVDYYSVLVDSNGNMNIDLTVDGLHPNTAGYRLMVPVAQKALALLGY